MNRNSTISFNFNSEAMNLPLRLNRLNLIIFMSKGDTLTRIYFSYINLN